MDLAGQLTNHCDLGPYPSPGSKNASQLPARRAARLIEKQRRLTAEEIERLVAMYQGGATVPEVCGTLDINRTTALAQLERAGVPRRANQPKLTGRRLAEAVRLYGSGRSLEAVGRALEIDAATVRKALAKAGVAIRPRRGWG